MVDRELRCLTQSLVIYQPRDHLRDYSHTSRIVGL
jgi:hypothetical protein